MIRIKAKFYGPFRDLFGGREREIELSADFSVIDLLRRLSDTEDREKQLFSISGGLHPHVVVMKNGAPVHGRDGMEGLLKDGDIIALFPFLGGG